MLIVVLLKTMKKKEILVKEKEVKRWEMSQKVLEVIPKKSYKSSKSSISSEESFKHKSYQPEWLKKIFPSFHYRLVLMNESDLIRNDILAYSPVAIKSNNHLVAFIAIPEESIQIGRIALHTIGVDLYLPSINKEALIEVYKIKNIRHATQLYLKPDQPLKSSSVSTVFKSHLHLLLLRGTGTLGSPFVLKIGSKIFIKPDKSTTSFTVSGIKVVEESTTFGKDNYKNSNFTNDSVFDDNEPGTSSEYITLDEWSNDSCSETNNSKDPSGISEVVEGISRLNLSSTESGGYITIDEYNEGDSKSELSLNNESKLQNSNDNSSYIESNIITSTPRKRSSKGSKESNSLYKSTLTGKCREQLISSIHLDDNMDSCKIPNLHKWFYIRKSTEIIIEEESIIKGDEHLEKKNRRKTQKNIVKMDHIYN